MAGDATLVVPTLAETGMAVAVMTSPPTSMVSEPTTTDRRGRRPPSAFRLEKPSTADTAASPTPTSSSPRRPLALNRRGRRLAVSCPCRFSIQGILDNENHGAPNGLSKTTQLRGSTPELSASSQLIGVQSKRRALSRSDVVALAKRLWCALGQQNSLRESVGIPFHVPTSTRTIHYAQSTGRPTKRPRRSSQGRTIPGASPRAPWRLRWRRLPQLGLRGGDWRSELQNRLQ